MAVGGVKSLGLGGAVASGWGGLVAGAGGGEVGTRRMDRSREAARR